MSPQLVAILAEIFAAQARVLGMHADNQSRQANGDAPAYLGSEFTYEANGLAHLAEAARNAF